MKFKIFRNGVYLGKKTLKEFATQMQSIYGVEYVSQAESREFTLVRA